MLPATTAKKNNPEKRLQKLFNKLPEDEQRMLLEFAEFLVSRTPAKTTPPQVPVPHGRPEKESVIRAVRRLSATYPMLDKAKMLNQTSALVAQHVMQGRPAAEVIDELEVIFQTHYDRYQSESEDAGQNG